MTTDEKLDYAILKCITLLPLSEDEVVMLKCKSHYDILRFSNIDEAMLEQVKSWIKHEDQRLSGLSLSLRDSVSEHLYGMKLNSIPRGTKISGDT